MYIFCQEQGHDKMNVLITTQVNVWLVHNSITYTQSLVFFIKKEGAKDLYIYLFALFDLILLRPMSVYKNPFIMN